MADIVSGIIWGPFVLIPLLFGVGVFLTIRLRLLQLVRLPHGLWLAFAHGHWGLTMAAVTGRLIAEMMMGATPFTDPAPYRAERFS